MTVQEIKTLVTAADPGAKHYESAKDGSNYTVWMEYERTGMPGDDIHEEGWKFQIDRYTKQEYDPVAEAIEQALKDQPGLAFTYMVEYERDTRYIHHIFDCEG
jgi:hypothetical protein